MSDNEKQYEALCNTADKIMEMETDNTALLDRIARLEKERDALTEAITPSTETKIAYWGDDNLISDWTAIKAVMKAIKARAAGYLQE
jgi:seryl-tRNA synthetase